MNPPGGWLLADVGNTRVKLAWLADGAAGVARLFDRGPKSWDERLTFPTGVVGENAAVLANWLATKTLGGIWISSVRPQAVHELVALLDQVLADRPQADVPGVVLSSAADAGLIGRMSRPEKTGADRALAVRAALRLKGGRGAGVVVLCGTAMTVERIDADGVWLGGAIAPGFRLGAEALEQGTAGLMRVGMVDREPFAYGTETRTAIEAGLFWGLVGAAKELIARSVGAQEHWEIWSGGDAPMLARWAAGPDFDIVDDLVLMGLADWASSQVDESAVERSV
jgi:type III pantothenate kinase